jgi:hypothetical protein
LNRLGRNLDSLDESIEDARKAPKGEKPSDKRARMKLLRDVIELQNQTLLAAKSHLLGRDETGSPVEPPNWFDDNDGSDTWKEQTHRKNRTTVQYMRAITHSTRLL